MSTFDTRALYVATLQTMHDGEQRLVETLPGMARIAGDMRLQSVFVGHRGESDSHRLALADMLDDLGETTAGSADQAVAALLGQIEARVRSGAATRDAGLLGIAWQILHCKTAGYATLIKLAAALGRIHDVAVLQQALYEDQVVDEVLSDIATRAAFGRREIRREAGNDIAKRSDNSKTVQQA